MGAERQDRCVVCGGLIDDSYSLRGISKHADDRDCERVVYELRERIHDLEEEKKPKEPKKGEYKTSEDLRAIVIHIPLDIARCLLTMCSTSAEASTKALELARASDYEVTPLQKKYLEKHVEACLALKGYISSAIHDNISREDQATIQAADKEKQEALAKELFDMLKRRIDRHCDDPDNCPDCRANQMAMDDYNADMRRLGRVPQEEFGDFEVPPGTILVPGSDKEN